jgi:hypothetical protein
MMKQKHNKNKKMHGRPEFLLKSDSKTSPAQRLTFPAPHLAFDMNSSLSIPRRTTFSLNCFCNCIETNVFQIAINM